MPKTPAMHFIRIKKAIAFSITAIVALSVFLYACQKELNGNSLSQQAPDLTKKVFSSVSGFVTDENDGAVNGAVVSMGGTNTTTDKYGFFEINNVPVVEEAAVVTVVQPAYFKGIKTYIATAGKSAFFRIKLIPKFIAGAIDAAAGGNITLSTGLTISFPANAIVNAATNSAYTGNVNVAAKWIDPVSDELNRIMPGDLRGLDSLGNAKLLTTYGMAAVELTGGAGELLQITAGKKATLTIPLPAGIATSAPATIPLWYFDETTGLWKQEGMAVKSGNNYVGQVGHFSYWNCDVPANYIRFNCTITNAKGVPVQNVLVKISVVGNPQSAGRGYTDSAGYTGGAIPNNAKLLLEVFSEFNCSTPLYSQNFTTTNADVALGNLKVPNASIADIAGDIVDCNNAPVNNGYVIMNKTGTNYRYRVGKNGAFSFSTPLCLGNTPITFSAEDYNTFQGSKPIPVTLVQGTNFIGYLNACGITIQEFINYSVNGTSYFISAPDVAQSSANLPNVNVKGYSNANSAAFYFAAPGIAAGSTGSLIYFNTRQIADSTQMLSPVSVNITEYGAVGGFLAGNFSGTFTGTPPANTPYKVTCRFRVKRSQ